MPVPIAVAPRLISQISGDGLLQPLLVLAEHHRVGGEFLAQRHRHRVLQLGAAHLEHVVELVGLRARTPGAAPPSRRRSRMMPA